jgi:hypothetical protein
MLFFRSLDNREFIGLKEGGSNIEEYIITHKLADDFAAYLKEVSGQEYEFAPNAQGENVLYCLMDGVRIPSNGWHPQAQRIWSFNTIG